jgi:hypothetical protein
VKYLRALVIAAIAATANLLLIPGAAAQVVGPTTIPGMTSFYAMAVTPQHIYLSPGPNGTSIAVMDPDGTFHGTIDDIQGPSGMAVQSRILYVAAYGAAEIERYDLTIDPPKKLAPLGTGALLYPHDLVVAGGRLWFTTLCGSLGSQFASMDLDGTHLRATPTNDTVSWSYCADILLSPFAPKVMFLRPVGLSSTTLTEFDITGGRARAIDSTDFGRTGFGGGPIAVMPGGETFVIPFKHGISTFIVRGMSGPAFTYRGDVNAAIATTDRSGGLVAGSVAVGSGIDVQVWRADRAIGIAAFDFPDINDSGVWTNGLEFSADGKFLFLLNGNPSGKVIFNVLDPLAPTTPQSVNPPAPSAAPRPTQAPLPPLAAPTPPPSRTLPFSLLVVPALLGLIVGFVARSKGYSFGLWWLFGSLLFIVALVAILVLRRKEVGSRASISEPFPTTPLAPPPVPAPPTPPTSPATREPMMPPPPKP